MEAYLVPERHHKAAKSLFEKLRQARDTGSPMIVLATREEIAAIEGAIHINIPESHLN